jgi:hypothetical protein
MIANAIYPDLSHKTMVGDERGQFRTMKIVDDEKVIPAQAGIQFFSRGFVTP